MDTNWQKQEYSKPLFDTLIWAKPEQKDHAGRLLIIGGNAHAITAPNDAYEGALKAGVGYAKVLLPRQTKKFFGNHLPQDIELVADTPSGSFSTKSFEDILGFSSWSDGLFFPGDIGRNSETAVVMESIANNILGIQIYTRDSLEYFSTHPENIFNRDETLLVLSLSQLQKMLIELKAGTPVTFDMGVVKLSQLLSELTLTYKVTLMTQYGAAILVAHRGRGVITSLPSIPQKWRLKSAAAAAVWWIQNPSKPLEALATALTQVDWDN